MNSSCNQDRFLRTGIALIVVTSIALYWLQHTGRLSGGAIAPSKLAWLATVIIYWYVLPVYWLLQPCKNRKLKLVCGLFLFSMLLRAVIELGMMYISNNWLHIYGIGHDIFSVVLCIIFALNLMNSYPKISVYFFFCAGLFTLETGFALYLKSITDSDGSIFFLEYSPQHSTVLWLTRIAVIVSIAMLSYLIRSKARVTA